MPANIWFLKLFWSSPGSGVLIGCLKVYLLAAINSYLDPSEPSEVESQQ